MKNTPCTISDQHLSRVSRFVTRWLGLHFPKNRWCDLERIIRYAAPELGFEDASACIDRVVSGGLSREQEDILAGHLTIGETYFFREQQSFDVLEKRILPDLIASRRGKDQHLRIWSAGCSTGEEPYSLAILLSRLIPDITGWRISILATDINSRALGKALQGAYSDWSFRGVPAWVRQRYFTQTGDGLFELSHAIKRMVTFSVLNLAEDIYPSLATNTNAMDLIFCRNVLMYFASKQQKQAIQGFQRSLLNGGYLVVSPCETSPAFSAHFETVMFPGAIFYKKNGQGERQRPLSAPPAAAWPVRLPPPSAASPPAPPPPPPSYPPPAAAAANHAPAVAEHAPYEEALALYRQGAYGAVAESLAGLLAHGEAAGGPPSVFAKGASLMAQALANQGKTASAIEWVEKAIAVDKLNAELYYLRATILQEQGDITQTIATLKQALYLDHTLVLAHFSLGTLTLRQGKQREAVKHFENALSLLGARGADDPVPGSEGMTTARLTEIIIATRAGIAEGDKRRRE